MNIEPYILMLENNGEYRHGGPNIELCIWNFNIVPNKSCRTAYRALHSEFEHWAEYRPREPTIELYI